MMHPRIRKLRTVAYFGRVWASGLALQLGLRPMRDRMLRPRITGPVPQFNEQEVLDYINRTGGDPDLYRDSEGYLLVPHTYFATWGLAELAKALLAARLPLNFTRVVHATSRVRVHRMQRVTEPARFSATVETVVRTGKRVRVEQQLATRTADAQPLAEHNLAMVLPEKRIGRRRGHKSEIVPIDTNLVTSIRLPPNEGWRYARLSGDFNPVHWIGPFAKLVGFDRPVAHGFDLMARTCHAAVAHLAQGDARKLKMIDIAFRKPVVLPAEVHLYAATPEPMASGNHRVRLWVGPEQEASAQIMGHVEIET
ncbi:MAG: MaoC/PaaZ C-terminal domain-containing protein [Myxococcota bacterium]